MITLPSTWTASKLFRTVSVSLNFDDIFLSFAITQKHKRRHRAVRWTFLISDRHCQIAGTVLFLFSDAIATHTHSLFTRLRCHTISSQLIPSTIFSVWSLRCSSLTKVFVKLFLLTALHFYLRFNAKWKLGISVSAKTKRRERNGAY